MTGFDREVFFRRSLYVDLTSPTVVEEMTESETRWEVILEMKEKNWRPKLANVGDVFLRSDKQQT